MKKGHILKLQSWNYKSKGPYSTLF